MIFGVAGVSVTLAERGVALTPTLQDAGELPVSIPGMLVVGRIRVIGPAFERGRHSDHHAFAEMEEGWSLARVVLLDATTEIRTTGKEKRCVVTLRVCVDCQVGRVGRLEELGPFVRCVGEKLSQLRVATIKQRDLAGPGLIELGWS